MKKLCSIILVVLLVVCSVEVLSVSVQAAEDNRSEILAVVDYKEDFINALMNQQSKWNSSKYEYFYFCDIDWDGHPELICCYPKNSTGYSLAEMYGYDRTNIFKYTLKGSSSTEFLDKKLLYYNIKDRSFIWICANVNTDADFCNESKSHHTNYTHWYNYELTTYEKNIVFDYYSGYCGRDGYCTFNRKADVEKGYIPGMYGYNYSSGNSYSFYQAHNNEHNKYLYGQTPVFTKYNFKTWSAKTNAAKKQDLQTGYNDFLNQNKLKNPSAINAVESNLVAPSWKQHYLSKLKNLNENLATVYFRDFDENGIPEMAVDSGYGGYGSYGQNLYTYFNKSCYDTVIGGYWYLSKYNNMLYVEGMKRPVNTPWEYGHIVYQIDNGKITQLFTGKAVVNNGETFDPKNPRANSYQYSINGGNFINVSSYNQLLQQLGKYLDKDRAMPLSSYGAYTISQAKSFIQNYELKPAAPTVSVANGVNGLDVAWGKVSNAQSYVVYYKTAATNWSSFSTSSTKATITNVGSGKFYYVQVQSIGSSGVKGNYSKVKTMTYLSRANITSLTYNGNNNLKMNAVPGANKYQIARLKSGDKAYTYFYSTTPSFTEKNAVGGIAYTYQVRAMYQTANNGTAYGAWSASKSVPTLVAPTVTLSNKSNGIRVTWNSIRGAIRYIVYFKKSTDKNWSSAITTNLYYPILNTQRGATYYVQVRPVGATVSQPYSSVKSIVYK